MRKQIKKDLEALEFQPEEFFSKLSENEKKDFLAGCSVIFNNKIFKKVCDDVGTLQILYTAKEAITAEDLAYGRGQIHGVAMLYETFAAYNAMHLQNIKKEENFDKSDVI